MRRKLFYILVSSAIALGALPLPASMLVVYTSTTSLSDTQGNVKGNPNESAPGFGEGSWQATGKKVNYYVTPFELFGTSAVKIADIASISYWTNQTGSLGSNWNLYIYTMPTATDNSAGWYKSRIVGIAPDGPAGWNLQDTSTLNWSDPSRNGGNYTTPVTWANLEAGSVTWPSGQSRDYRDETVKFFSLQTDGGATTFHGLLDGLTVSLNGGQTAGVNFETPEPATWSLFAIGAGLVGLARRYRR